MEHTTLPLTLFQLLPRPKELPAPAQNTSSHQQSPETYRSFLSFLDTMVEHMGSQLMEIDLQSREVERTFRDIKKDVEEMLHIPKPQPQIVENPFLFAFHLVHFPAGSLYVKRRFEVAFRAVPRRMTSAVVPFPLYCHITIHKMTPENEEVPYTRKGEQMLCGELTRVFETDGELRMVGLAFYDITGHLPQGRVRLVVSCVNVATIQPLVIDGVRVKARKRDRSENI